MSRSFVTLREGGAADVPFLVTLWQDTIRKADHTDQLADLELIVKTAAESPEQRLVVAEYDGVPAGAVLLRATTMNPLNLEPTVMALAPHVEAPYRRHGVGHSLMEAAVGFAEELGIGHVTTAATATSRDGNRFLARLGFAAQATFRAATTHTVRVKLAAQLPGGHRSAGRPALGQVLAARRSLRRAQRTA